MRLLTVNQVASTLACSARHVWTLAKTGAMPAGMHLGHAVRWSADKLSTWASAGCPPAAELDRLQAANRAAAQQPPKPEPPANG
jgi:predicted DNA-binding transcriptional regulator AlpA